MIRRDGGRPSAARWRKAPHWTIAHIIALLALCGATEARPAVAQIAAAPSQDEQFNEAVAALKLGNYAVALDAFEDLAERGDEAAQYNLGWMRAKGLGAPMDLVAAYQWFGLVAQAGQEKGRQSLAEVRALLTPAQIAEGERRIRAFQARRD